MKSFVLFIQSNSTSLHLTHMQNDWIIIFDQSFHVYHFTGPKGLIGSIIPFLVICIPILTCKWTVEFLSAANFHIATDPFLLSNSQIKKNDPKQLQRANMKVQEGKFTMPSHRWGKPTGKHDQLDIWSPKQSFNCLVLYLFINWPCQQNQKDHTEVVCDPRAAQRKPTSQFANIRQSGSQQVTCWSEKGWR